jgi:site-specific recombinase XerD
LGAHNLQLLSTYLLTLLLTLFPVAEVFMPTLFKRSNGIYYAILADSGGRRRWVSTGQRTRSQALKRFAELGQGSRKTLQSRTVQEFLSDFRAYAKNIYSAENLGIYERSFRSFVRHVGNLKLGAVSQRHVDLFKGRRLGEVGKNTVNIELRTLRAAFYLAVRWKILAENPFKQVKLCPIDQQIPVYLSQKDFTTLLSIVPIGVFRDLIIVATLTGLRKGELINLRRVDVDLANRVLRISSHGNFRTKGGRRRVVPLHPLLVSILSRRLVEEQGEFIFSMFGRQLSPYAVSMRFKRYVQKAGLDERLHFHSMRHTFASWLVQSSASLYEVQRLLGHSSIRVTEIYSHLEPTNLHSAVGRLQIEMA